MTTWWWNQQYRAQSVQLVWRPLAWWVMWWTSQPDAGWSQPLGNRQCWSRWITARRIAAGMSRLTPTSSGRLGPARRAPSCSRRQKLASPPGPDTKATALPMIFRSRALPPPDVRRRARPGRRATELLAAQEAGQPARTRYQGYGLANDLPFQGITAARRRRHRTGQRDLIGPGGPGRRGGRGGRGRRGGVRGWVAAGAGVVAAGSVRAVAVAGEFYAEPDEVVQDGGVNLAHHDRGDGRVAGEGLGGASFQPGTAVAA